MTALWLIVLCGVLAILYAIWTIRSVLAADPGSARMQEIAAAVREGAQAYLKRQYTTIGVVGIVIFFILAYFLGASVAVGFLIGAVLSGVAGFIGMNVSVRANVRTAQAAIGSLAGVLVVQGGPGTGKTAVALHRAAYLLYTHRFPLERWDEAVLALKVTPQITPDNRIIMDLDVRDDSVGNVVVASGGVNVPSINTREIATQVLVNDGQTVVLGGILETTQREDDTKVPYLGDIPVLGHLFKNTSHQDNKDELMIFITPKIVREGVNVY